MLYFWYKNSILASLVSVFGCVMVAVAIGDGVFGLVIPGAALIALGKYISNRKEKKKNSQK